MLTIDKEIANQDVNVSFLFWYNLIQSATHPLVLAFDQAQACRTF
jgi:hypothetical protein